MFTQSEENYLKTIFSLQQEKEGGVSTSAIAEKLKTKAASVTEMIKRLADKNLLDYQKYYGVELTEIGLSHALLIVRKHRLWETFLVQQLGFNWDEVHEVAEQLEHIKSEKLTEALDKLLGYPKTDPHGDPIPDRDGHLIQKNNALLSECTVGAKGVIVGVKDSSAAFLQYLDKEQIALGATFELKNREQFDGALEAQIENKVIKVSNKMASNLYVEL